METVKLGLLIKKTKVARCGEHSYPVLSITKQDGIIMQSEKFKKRIASADTSDYKIIPRGKLVQGIHIDEGNFGIQDIVDNGIVSPAYGVWNVNDGLVIPKYLEMVLRSPKSIEFYRSKLTGTVNRRGHMSDADFLSMDIPLPDRDTQSKILKTMKQTTSVLYSRQQQLAKLDELIKARFVEMFGDVISNSNLWPICKFSEITSSRLGKMLDAKQQKGVHRYPYLANFNVQWFRFELKTLNSMDFNESDRIEFELHDGDLLVCEGGEIGRCAVWHNNVQPCYFQKALHRVRCNKDFILPDFLAWWFKYNCDHGGFSAIEGAKATIAHLPGAKLKNLDVCVPPLPLQNQFAAFVAEVDKSKFIVLSKPICFFFSKYGNITISIWIVIMKIATKLF